MRKKGFFSKKKAKTFLKGSPGMPEPTEIMGSNHLLYFLLATVLHSKQYCMEEILIKKDFCTFKTRLFI